MASVVVYIICGTIIFIAVALIALYCADTKFKDYSSKFNILFTLILALDNVIRLIPGARDDHQDSKDMNQEEGLFCKMQAFLLTFFDKLMFTLMTSYSCISCIVLCNKEEYRNKNKEKKLYFFSILISVFLSIVSSIIFYAQGISDRSEFCYVETKSLFKQWVDSTITIVLFIINFICIILILIQLNIMKKENWNSLQNESYNYDFKRFIIGLIINIMIFVNVFLLIIKSMPFDSYVKDIIYILLSFLVDLYIIVNNELKNYIKKCCKCENQDDNNNVNNNNLISERESNANNDENNA